MFEDIDRKYGGVHVLINNAGLGHKTSLIDGETSYWREMLEEYYNWEDAIDSWNLANLSWEDIG